MGVGFSCGIVTTKRWASPRTAVLASDLTLGEYLGAALPLEGATCEWSLLPLRREETRHAR
jgi:hypothetical protein